MTIRFRTYSMAHQILCWLLMAVTAFAHSAWLVAAQPTQAADSTRSSAAGDNATVAHAKLDLKYCTTPACAALFIHPRRVLTDPTMEMLPVEVVSAAGLKELGIDPVDVEHVQAFVEPPMAGPPSFAIVVKFTKPFRVNDLKRQLYEHAVPAELGGKRYLKSRHPILPSFYMPDTETLLIATEEMLNRIIAGRREGASSPLLDDLKSANSSDAYVAVSIDMLRPLVDVGLDFARKSDDVPPPIVPLLDAPDLIRTVDASVALVSDGPTQLVIHAKNEEAAKELEGLIDNGLATMRQQLLAELERQEQSEDPVERAVAQYMKRISGRMIELYRPARDGDKLVLGGQPAENQQQLFSMATIGILVALLLPAVQAAREAARRTACVNNMKQIMLSLHNYASTHGRFPARANFDKNGKPLLSWRVHVLPYLEAQSLYDQFHLNEPWDSPHNKKLISRMPAVYRCPSSPLEDPKTTYLLSNGKGLFAEGKEGVAIRQIPDGTSNTIALVEVEDEHAVIWTKPEDLRWSPEHPLAKVGGNHPGIFNAAFADGSIHAIARDIDTETLKALFTRNGGESIGGVGF